MKSALTFVLRSRSQGAAVARRALVLSLLLVASVSLGQPGRYDRSRSDNRYDRGRSDSRFGRDRSDGRSSTSRGPYDAQFEKYRIVLDRNVFDSERDRPRPPEPTRGPPPPPPPPAPRSEQLALVGTFLNTETTGTETYAFFDGSGSDYDVCVKLGERVAGFRVVQLSSEQVTLWKDGRQVVLRVGSGMARRGDEDWRIASASELRSEREDRGGSPSSGGSSSGNGPSSSTASASSGGDGGKSDGGGDGEMSEVLKRLMEKRRKEME